MNPEIFIEHQVEHALHAIMPSGVELHVPHIGFDIKSQAWALSAFLLAIGIMSGRAYYLGRPVNEWDMERTGWRKSVYKFLWNRWYMNSIYYLLFVDGLVLFAKSVHSGLEKMFFDRITPVVSGLFISLGIDLYDKLETEILDEGLNNGVPNLAHSIYDRAKKLQTGVLSYNIAYMMIIFVVIILVLLRYGGMN